jgi:hypothetical protein
MKFIVALVIGTMVLSTILFQGFVWLKVWQTYNDDRHAFKQSIRNAFRWWALFGLVVTLGVVGDTIMEAASKPTVPKDLRWLVPSIILFWMCLMAKVLVSPFLTGCIATYAVWSRLTDGTWKVLPLMTKILGILFDDIGELQSLMYSAAFVVVTLGVVLSLLGWLRLPFDGAG